MHPSNSSATNVAHVGDHGPIRADFAGRNVDVGDVGISFVTWVRADHSAITTASAVASVWVIDRWSSVTDCEAARSAAPPVRRKLGLPEAARTTSTSWNLNAPKP